MTASALIENSADKQYVTTIVNVRISVGAANSEWNLSVGFANSERSVWGSEFSASPFLWGMRLILSPMESAKLVALISADKERLYTLTCPTPS